MPLREKKPKKIKYDLNDNPIPPAGPVKKVFMGIGYAIIILVVGTLAVRLFTFGDSSFAKTVFLLPQSAEAFNADPANFEIYRIGIGDTMSADGSFRGNYIYYVPSAGQLSILIKYRVSLTAGGLPFPYRVYLTDADGGSRIQGRLIAKNTNFNYYELRYSFSGVTLDTDLSKWTAAYIIEVTQAEFDGSETVLAEFSIDPVASTMTLYKNPRVQFSAGPIDTGADAATAGTGAATGTDAAATIEATS